MRLTSPPDGTAGEVNLILLQIAYPAFEFWQFARAGLHSLRWAAVRKNGADPACAPSSPPTLNELTAALARDQAHTTPGQPGTRP
jgi:hypothetical protein